MIVDPFPQMNDGLMDLFYLSDPKIQNLMGISAILDKAKKKGGTHVYDRTACFQRCKTLKFDFEGI